MAQQTALEWLLEQIENKNDKEFTSYYTEFIEQAKAMEREQIRMAFTDGKLDGKFKDLKSEQYYNENYNK
jgi:hypothetical protein